MTLTQFARWVKARWSGPQRPNDLAIMALGLTGESGEVFEACANLSVASAKVSENIKKEIRGSRPAEREALILELGDVLHYWCCIANHYNLDVEHITRANVDKLEARERLKSAAEFNTKPKIKPGFCGCEDCVALAVSHHPV